MKASTTPIISSDGTVDGCDKEEEKNGQKKMVNKNNFINSRPIATARVPSQCPQQSS